MRTARTKAKAIPNSHVLGYANTGTEQIGIRVNVIEGHEELQGKEFTWYGYFTDKSEERTLQALMTAGWDGSDFVNLAGLGSTEFELQFEEQDEVDEQGQVTGAFWRPTFINKIGVAMKHQMDEGQKRSFASRMNALAKNLKGPQASGQPRVGGGRPQADSNDDLRF